MSDTSRFSPSFRRLACAPLAVLVALSCAPLAAQQHAHTHGVVALDVAVDAATVTLRLEAPLESLVGFERAPRNAAERQRVDAAVAALRSGERVFGIDPAARCVLRDVDLQAPVLGLGGGKHDHGHDHDHGKDHGKAHGHTSHGKDAGDAHGDHAHADLNATYVFACEQAGQARFVDLPLFDTFRSIRMVNGQVAAPQGQFRRSMGRTDRRLAWGR